MHLPKGSVQVKRVCSLMPQSNRIQLCLSNKPLPLLAITLVLLSLMKQNHPTLGECLFVSQA